MDEEYLSTLQRRVKRLEEMGKAIKKRQHHAQLHRKATMKSFLQEIEMMNAQLDITEKNLHLLATNVKKFVASFQHYAMKNQLSTLDQRADMLRFAEWIPRKELKRVIEKIQ